MSDSILEISHKHGQEMYIIGLEHAVRMIEVAGDGALEELKAQVEQEKREVEALDHSRFNEVHRKICNDCRDAYNDLYQEMSQEEIE